MKGPFCSLSQDVGPLPASLRLSAPLRGRRKHQWSQSKVAKIISSQSKFRQEPDTFVRFLHAPRKNWLSHRYVTGDIRRVCSWWQKMLLTHIREISCSSCRTRTLRLNQKQWIPEQVTQVWTCHMAEAAAFEALEVGWVEFRFVQLAKYEIKYNQPGGGCTDVVYLKTKAGLEATWQNILFVFRSV